MRDIAEILEHWQARRTIGAISRSLDVSRATIRKYVYAAEARGYRQGDPTPPQGWKAFIAEVLFRGRRTRLPDHRYLPPCFPTKKKSELLWPLQKPRRSGRGCAMRRK